jgi:HSP20 family protein
MHKEIPMADISVRRSNENRLAPVSREWEARSPFRLMRDLMGWDPFSEMVPYLPAGGGEFSPSFEVKETKDAYLFKADVPGVKESDLDITVTGNRLTVSGKREAEKEEQTDRYYSYERSYGSFSRSFTLPEGVDVNGVRADLKDGVLALSVRKVPEVQPKKIAIQSAAKKS